MRRRLNGPDPLLLALGQVLGVQPTAEAVLAAAAAARRQVVISEREELRALIREAVREERAEQLLSDREIAEELGVGVRTWQAWVRETPELAERAEPGPGPRRWRLSAVMTAKERPWARRAPEGATGRGSDRIASRGER